MSLLLEVRDLRVRFATDAGLVSAVAGLSLDLGARELLALVGESGCGKSLTALSIMGLQPEQARVEGSVRFDGAELLGDGGVRQRAIRGRDVAMVFQEPMTSLNPVLTVGRQLTEGMRHHRGLSRADARRRAVELLDLVRIPEPRRRLSEYPHQMSGGMRQRVMIAMAVAAEARVVIADEPTTALDVTIQAQVLEILRDLRVEFGTAVLLITHDLGVVADAADRVVVMYAGHKVEEAPVERLFGDPQHPYTHGLLGAVPRPGAGVERLTEIPGLVPLPHDEPAECVFAPRCPRVRDDCRAAMPAFASVADDGVAGGGGVACLHPGRGGA